jgi:hypothetical protein
LLLLFSTKAIAIVGAYPYVLFILSFNASSPISEETNLEAALLILPFLAFLPALLLELPVMKSPYALLKVSL